MLLSLELHQCCTHILLTPFYKFKAISKAMLYKYNLLNSIHDIFVLVKLHSLELCTTTNCTCQISPAMLEKLWFRTFGFYSARVHLR